MSHEPQENMNLRPFAPVAAAWFVAMVLFGFVHSAHAARTINWATLNGAATVTVEAGATISAAINVTHTGGGTANNWYSTGWLISTTAPGTPNCVDTPNHGSNTTETETFNVTAPLATGTYNAYFIAYDDNGCTSGASATYTLIGAVVVVVAPTVSTIDRADPSPTSATSVSWTVTFSQSVTGVNAADFTLVQSGVSGASITSVTGSGTAWTVTANTGSGSGTLGLNLVDNDSIQNGSGVPLGGAGAGNGNFTGEVYAVDKMGTVINAYFPGTANVAVGATSITLGAASGASTPIAVGDLVIIMQMQDAAINSTNTAAYGDGAAGDPGSGTTDVRNSGLYEYAVAASAVPLSGGTLTLSCGTRNAYTNAAAAGADGQRRFQVIRVPVFANATLVSTLTALAWNGTVGGVLAFDVTGALTLNSATVSVNGLGFRGGAARTLGGATGFAYTDYRTVATSNANGSKGEGIAGTPRYLFTAPGTLTNTGVEGYPNGSHARGAPGNAGGGATDRDPSANDENPGGGGGANAGAGGIGGIGWCGGFNTTGPYYGCGYAALVSAVNPNGSTGGFGGAAVPDLGAARLTLGGGGGAGTSNNGTGSGACSAVSGLCTSGAAGGGIIMVRAGSMTGTATFNARGSNGDSTISNDGSGGAGAGGTVLINAGSGIGGVTINVSGGTGGSNLVPPLTGHTPHGPGGGGGGGIALTSGTPAACSAAGGANGVTYNNGAAFGAYGAMPGSAGSCGSGLTSTQIPGSGLGGVPACPAAIHHFNIDVGAASASTCTPKNITISARNASDAVITDYVGTVNISTSTAHGNWATVSANGTLNNGTADDGAATYAFVIADAGVVTLALSNTHADDLTVGVVDSGVPTTASTSATINFRDSAFVITPDTIQIAGRNQATTVSLYTRVGGSCAVDTGYTGTKNLDAWLTLDADHPSGATVPTISALTLPIVAPASNPTSNNLSLDFTNGVATLTLSTTDVGKYSLNLRDDTRLYATAVDLSGASNSIVTRPWIHIAAPVAGSGAANGAVFTSAGTAFTTTVRGVLWEGADDADNNGIPDGGADLSGNSLAPRFAWGTSLAAAAPFTPATPLDTPAGTGTAGALSNGSFLAADYSGGSASRADTSYSEVGSFTMTATAANYLNTAGLDLVGSVSPVGRFTPAYFDVARIHGCIGGANFTYSGQPFTVTVTARNAAGNTTLNFDGALGFSKETRISNAGDEANFSSNVLAAADFVSGVRTQSGVTYTFAAAETAPVTLALRAIDNPDGVSSAGHTEETTQVRSGRIRIHNGYGSELADLSVPMYLEYYESTANGWRTQIDTCSTVTLNALSNFQGNLGSTETCVQDTGSPGVSGQGCAAAGPASERFLALPASGSPSPPPLGSYNLYLRAPGAGNEGSVDVSANLTSMTWLRYDWDGDTTPDDPTGKATFGTYRGSPRHIYLRERY